MKAFLAGVAATILVVIGFEMWRGVREAEWIIGALKNPGTFALTDIQADLNAKRYELAKEKLDLLLKTWHTFSAGPDSCSGAGLSEVAGTFSKMRECVSSGKQARNLCEGVCVSPSGQVGHQTLKALHRYVAGSIRSMSRLGEGVVAQRESNSNGNGQQ